MPMWVREEVQEVLHERIAMLYEEIIVHVDIDYERVKDFMVQEGDFDNVVEAVIHQTDWSAVVRNHIRNNIKPRTAMRGVQVRDGNRQGQLFDTQGSEDGAPSAQGATQEV